MRQPSLIRASIRASWLLAAGLLSTATLAQPPRGGHGPPPEAIEACAGQGEGAACTVTFQDRSLEGTCEAHGESLACRPARPPGPPPEAVAACQGRTEGQACTVTFQDQQLQGTCRGGPPDSQQDTSLACRPAHPGPPGGGGGRR